MTVLGLGFSTGAVGLEGIAGGGKDLRFCSLVIVVGAGELGTEEGDSICLLTGIGDCTGGGDLLMVSVLALGRVYMNS